MIKYLIILLFPGVLNAQNQDYNDNRPIPNNIVMTLFCVKDTAKVFVTASATNTGRRRLRMGYLACDKCRFPGDVKEPITWHYYNLSFLNRNKLPYPARIKIYKYERKNWN